LRSEKKNGLIGCPPLPFVWGIPSWRAGAGEKERFVGRKEKVGRPSPPQFNPCHSHICLGDNPPPKCQLWAIGAHSFLTLGGMWELYRARCLLIIQWALIWTPVWGLGGMCFLFGHGLYLPHPPPMPLARASFSPTGRGANFKGGQVQSNSRGRANDSPCV